MVCIGFWTRQQLVPAGGLVRSRQHGLSTLDGASQTGTHGLVRGRKRRPLSSAAVYEVLHSLAASPDRRHLTDRQDLLVAKRADDEVAVREAQHETSADRVVDMPRRCVGRINSLDLCRPIM